MITAPALSAVPGIRHAFFTREGGVSTGVYATLNGGAGSSDDPANIRENRARMAASLGVGPERFVAPWQVHSAHVHVAVEPWTRETAPRVDALVTREPGLALAISTADCGPLLFADPDARVVGAAHAGWRGALDGVAEATIEAMEGLGARRERIVVALGPMIRQPNYEVGPEFVARFSEAEPSNERFFRPAARDGHSLFDLPGFLAARLARAGVGRVEDLGRCTYADEGRFFSYRRMTHRGEPDYGRMLHAIVIEG